MKVKIILSYDGSKFRGSQIQKEHNDTVMAKLYKIFRSLNIHSKFNLSGRTDARVHAKAQVLDIELPPFWHDLSRLKIFLNRLAYPDIYVKKIEKVASNFHARFSAKKRVYHYMISTNKPSVFMSSYVSFVKDIDQKAIKKAIKLYEGEHKFTYFKKTKSTTTTDICTIYKARFYQHKEFYIFYFEANRFLRSQIRMMVGFLLKISEKKLSIHELQEQLSCERKHSSFLSLPNGLYLAKIKY